MMPVDQTSADQHIKLHIFIGRFQPLHLGHLYIISHALNDNNSKNHLLILCGTQMMVKDYQRRNSRTDNNSIDNTDIDSNSRHHVGIDNRYDRNFLSYKKRVSILSAAINSIFQRVTIISCYSINDLRDHSFIDSRQ